MIVNGGGLSRAGPAVLDAVTWHLRPLTLVPTPIELTRLGDDAVVMGAVRVALTRPSDLPDAPLASTGWPPPCSTTVATCSPT
jgi:hypothetical protein